ncbi:hypothetical protein CANTEDRAFT_114386 [Yamadazyma tenuis ATCC 10573]|uniref:Peroxin/Ferlin domain-containing protein n=1 Tax=Candida tenuis (strain ATCC 10573 / BCRC 21748 / CBS 615 / JCM 9827 / NBRC 10315 / NRRL Y-1498 / VKM Y-70) TaxID=590646 RepID=G3B720_CANTC|nr:uncharacterized protein CANTEDRAFT_114386 [Yamadazyma tenuis ATCC 10573]XP_006687330.1 uncharacterized protein CANTEDRAFT_114386 [Yamadazyma tenuis ATCC 10573]EGV63536.1 hypothetical protein CANTEDRAFT_114386 [Yamadazyma tenuis ATCC 10573]EGV63537.1 hypothetical protein CANTEDRAFT_114386 [Yamadazyma tenuis ATCC 10573]
MEDLFDKQIDPRLSHLPQLSEFFQYVTVSKLLNPAFIQKLNSMFVTNDDGYEYKLELVVENQRGLKIFGIPMFSSNSLIPMLDPSSFQLLNGQNLKVIDNNLNNLPLPDLNWQWHWECWYVLMLNDVDDQGWIYSKINFNSHHWKGKYYFGNFIRRRVWIRLRHRSLSEMSS